MCAGGTCPRLVKTTDGKFLIQGFKISDEIKNHFSISENEEMLEIPEELITNIINQIK